MHSKLLFAIVLLGFGLLSGRAGAALLVVATTSDLAALARSVGGERVEVRALSSPAQDPHWVDPKPSLALELSRADLLLAVGAGLEQGWLPSLRLGSRNPRIQNGARGFLDCSTLVELIERTSGADRSHGDIHAGGNPHYLLDPRAALRVGVGIGKRLAELDPDGAATYLERTRRFVAELTAREKAWNKALERVRGRPAVAYHRSLAYLARWAGFEVIEHVEPKPGIPPNPRHVAELLERAKRRGVRAVLQERWHPTSTSTLIAGKLGAKLVRLPGGPDLGRGEDYASFLDGIVRQLEGAL